MFWARHKSPIDPDSEAWILECWAWLLRHLDDLETFRKFPLVLPTPEFFPPSDAEGHARVEHVFRCVAGLTNTADWPYRLEAQDASIDPKLGPLAVVQNTPVDPHGTFSYGPRAGLPVRPIKITYNPSLLRQPVNLVATLVHEIAHGILFSIDAEPPGGVALEEWATDLTTVFLGFGIFGTNSAFAFQQYSDIGGGSQGWSYQRSGYLSEPEWAFALAVFLALRGEDSSKVGKWLKPAPLATVKKSLKYLEKNSEALAALTG